MSAPEEPALPAPKPRHGWRWALAVAVVVAVVAALGYALWSPRHPATPAARPSASPSPSASPGTAQIYADVAPSVVSIEFRAGDGTGRAGTGVVVNADATILTADHVVAGTGAIRVTFADGTVSAATVAAADPGMDIAMLTPATLPSLVVPAVIGGAGRLAIGDSVLAIGDPLGLTRTATTGVVSGLDRSASGPGGGTLSGLIQFDAAVNPGSSGGPLVDAKGQTVGIVVALANPESDTFIGIGFAVPIGAALGAGGGQRQPQQ
jgi:putative serine protease PepD